MKQRIAVLEDDESIRDVLGIILDANNYEVLHYSTGEELLRDDPESIDLFLVDYRLPGISGVEVCKKLKSNAASRMIPVILISADFFIRRRLHECGADAAIDKPFSRLELLSKIEELTANAH